MSHAQPCAHAVVLPPESQVGLYGLDKGGAMCLDFGPELPSRQHKESLEAQIKLMDRRLARTAVNRDRRIDVIVDR